MFGLIAYIYVPLFIYVMMFMLSPASPLAPFSPLHPRLLLSSPLLDFPLSSPPPIPSSLPTFSFFAPGPLAPPPSASTFSPRRSYLYHHPPFSHTHAFSPVLPPRLSVAVPPSIRILYIYIYRYPPSRRPPNARRDKQQQPSCSLVFPPVVAVVVIASLPFGIHHRIPPIDACRGSSGFPLGRFLLFILLFLLEGMIQVWPCCKLAGFVFGFVFGLGLGLGFRFWFRFRFDFSITHWKARENL